MRPLTNFRIRIRPYIPCAGEYSEGRISYANFLHKAIDLEFLLSAKCKDAARSESRKNFIHGRDSSAIPMHMENKRLDSTLEFFLKKV